MGTALTEQQVDALAPARAEGAVLPGPRRARARRRSRAASTALRGATTRDERRARRRVPDRPPAGRAGSRPTSSSATGADAMRALLEPAVPIERFEVERALERGPSTDARARRAAIARCRSVLRAELIKLVADRLSVPARGAASQLVAGRLGRRPRAWRRPRRPPSTRRRRGRAAGRARRRTRRRRPEPVDPRAALDRREQSERAFLAYCLALPEEGEARLAAADLDELLLRARRPAAPPSTSAAACAPRPASLPARRRGARPPRRRARHPRRRARGHARQARARGPPARPPPPRPPHRRPPAPTGHERIRALAAERQQVLDAIRHRLT